MDEHVPQAVSQGLQRRGVDVLTTQEAGLLSVSDEEHLKFAAESGRIIFTQDADFLRLHDEGYDFSKARTSRQKAEVVSIWIGEILYEALTYKNAEAVKSLTETIKTEIEELIKDEL